MKNTLLDVFQNFDKMSDSEKAEVNDNVRKQFDNIIHGNPPKTEREKEIDKLAREELEEYRRKKKAFYGNPIHWNNNKRRRHGLPVLRGSVNKCRLKEYPGFHPSVRFFCMMEDLFDEILITTMEDDLNSFVKVNSLSDDDKKYAAQDYENHKDEFSKDWSDLSESAKEKYYTKYAKENNIVDEDAKTYEEWRYSNLETFVDRYTSKSGDKIVAFGKYGYDD